MVPYGLRSRPWLHALCHHPCLHTDTVQVADAVGALRMNYAARTTAVTTTAETRRWHGRKAQLLRKVLAHIVLLIGATIMVIPMVWMISTSLKEEGAVFTYPLR